MKFFELVFRVKALIGVCIFGDWVVTRFVIATWFSTETHRFSWLQFTDVGICLFAAFQSLVLLVVLSLVQSIASGPGSIKEEVAPEHLQNAEYCKLCDRWKPPRAHHCLKCQRCVFRPEGHLNVVGCVGFGNLKLWILFIIYSIAICLITLLMLIISAVCWLWSRHSWYDAIPCFISTSCSGILMIVCVVYLLVGLMSLPDYVETIRGNLTCLESYRGVRAEKISFMENFRKVFGARWWLWPIPMATHMKPDYMEIVSKVGESAPFEDECHDCYTEETETRIPTGRVLTVEISLMGSDVVASCFSLSGQNPFPPVRFNSDALLGDLGDHVKQKMAWSLVRFVGVDAQRELGLEEALRRHTHLVAKELVGV